MDGFNPQGVSTIDPWNRRPVDQQSLLQPPQPTCEFNVGDVVVLKSGGPKMTVVLISPYNTSAKHFSITVKWFNKTDDMKQETVSSLILETYTEKPIPRIKPGG